MNKAPSSDPESNAAGLVSEPSAHHLNIMTELFQQGQKPHHDAFPEMFGSGDNLDSINYYLKSFLKPRNPFRARTHFSKGWFIDNDLRGYLLYQLYEETNIFYGKKRWVCFVEDIVINNKNRSLGGASSLMDSMMFEIKDLENCMLSATVWNGNEASEALFQKYGFNALSKSYYRAN